MANKNLLRGVLGALEAGNVTLDEYRRNMEFKDRASRQRREDERAEREFGLKEREAEARRSSEEAEEIFKLGAPRSSIERGRYLSELGRTPGRARIGQTRPPHEEAADISAFRRFSEKRKESGKEPDDLAEMASLYRNLADRSVTLDPNEKELMLGLRERLRGRLSIKKAEKPASSDIPPEKAPGFFGRLTGGISDLSRGLLGGGGDRSPRSKATIRIEAPNGMVKEYEDTPKIRADAQRLGLKIIR